MKIAIVTDSTTTKTPKILAANNIKFIDLTANYEDKSYYDSNIDLIEYFDEIDSRKELPTTSQPGPSEFAKVYKLLLKEYDFIFVITLSPALSGTYNSANLAISELNDQSNQVKIFSSYAAASSSAMVIEKMLELIENKSSIEDIEKMIKQYQQSQKSSIMPESLKYLAYGGRIPAFAPGIGNMINLNLLLSMENDESPYVDAKALGSKKIFKKVVEEIIQAKADKVYVTSVIADPKKIELLENKLSEHNIEVVYGDASAVISTHFGRGSIVVSYLKGVKNEKS